MALHALLDRLLIHAERLDPTLRGQLQPGLDSAQIERIAPLPLPEAAVQLYTWRNGAIDEDSRLFYYHRFLPLADAAALYRTRMQVNQQIGEEGYRPHLFPLFEFMGESYSIWCGEPAARTGAIYFVFHGDVQVYDDLPAMLNAILACYDSGAYRIEGGETRIDKERVAAIKARWNRCRHLPDGGTLGYHP